MIRKKYVILLISILLIAFFYAPASIFAAKKSYSTFGVQPTKVEFDGSITKRQETDILVLNFSEHPVDVKVMFGDFIFTNKAEQLYIFTKPKELPVSAVPYLSITPAKLTIPAKGRKTVKLFYDAGGRKILSGKYSAALFEVEGKIKKGKATISVAGRIASTVFIVPGKGSIRREGHINFFKPESSIGLGKEFFGLKKEPGFIVSYTNTGNTHLNVKGSIYIEDIFGRRIQTINFPEYEVYPGVTRDIEIPWTKPVVGYHRASVNVKSYLYDYNKKQLSKESRFFYLPYLYIIGAVILLAGSVAYFVKRRLKSKKKKAAAKEAKA